MEEKGSIHALLLLDAALDASFLYGRSYAFTRPVFPGAVWKLSPLAFDRRSLLRNVARRLFFLRRPRATDAVVGLARAIVRVTEVFRLRPLSAKSGRPPVKFRS